MDDRDKYVLARMSGITINQLQSRISQLKMELNLKIQREIDQENDEEAIERFLSDDYVGVVKCPCCDSQVMVQYVEDEDMGTIVELSKPPYALTKTNRTP
jgi:hypothetical protein